jgi:hypothetical protein
LESPLPSQKGEEIASASDGESSIQLNHAPAAPTALDFVIVIIVIIPVVVVIGLGAAFVARRVLRIRPVIGLIAAAVGVAFQCVSNIGRTCRIELAAADAGNGRLQQIASDQPLASRLRVRHARGQRQRRRAEQ